MSQLKTYILNRFAGKSANYTSWMKDCPYECRMVESFAPNWEVPDDAGIVVTHMHYRWEEVSALRRIYEQSRVPILILADGVLEYRNTFENPGVSDGAVFQPVIGHKLACIGRAQVRTVESWGNIGKCELVGMPRLDSIVASQYLPVQKEGPFRILIATANTPAFNQQQHENLIESLRLLRERFDLNDTVNGRRVEVTWRLTNGIEKEIGLEAESDPLEKPIPISDAIELADAVITTPSTMYLESVMKRRPTAILDFNNSPAYVPSAWNINAPLHLNPVISELENPSPAKMQFQRSVLMDQLENDSKSQQRIHTLIESMVEAGVAARQSDSPIKLPFRILPDSQRGFHRVETDFDARSLYPDNPAFEIRDVERLQVELSHAVARLGQLPADLERKDADITSKNLDLDRKDANIERLVAEMDALLVKKNADLKKKDEHINSMTELFQNANARVKLLRQRYLEQANMMAQLKQQLLPKEAFSPADAPVSIPINKVA